MSPQTTTPAKPTTTHVAPTPTKAPAVPMTPKTMKASKNGIDLIAKYEGLSLKPYLCPAKIPTIGYGNTVYENGQKVTLNDAPITKERAFELLNNQVNAYYAPAVDRYVQVDINQNQFDALVCFAYNVGVTNLQKSTLLKLINEKKLWSAANQFVKWNKANGKVLDGLTKRRLDEKKLFTTPVASTNKAK